jgi:hypothetical protein
VIYPPENIDYSDFDDNAERKKIENFYALKLWEAKVKKRKDEYSRISKLIDNEQFSKAGEELSFLKPIKSPNLKNSVYFDDRVEHQKLLNRVLEANWYKSVKTRREQYSKIESLVNEKKFDEAIKILSETSERLTKPDIKGLSDYDDDQERAALLSGDLGMLIVYQIFNSGMSGVQHYRLTSDGELLSVIVVGRAHINHSDKKTTIAIREAVNRAEIEARNEFAKFLKVRQTSLETSKINYNGEKVEESYKSATSLETTTIISGMILLAKGVHEDEVVCIMGWQSPQNRINTIMPMKIFQKKEFSISPSIGFFL